LINIYTLITWFLDDHKTTLTESALKPLYQVQQNVEKMDHLIKGILDYATIDKLTTADREIDLKALLEDVMETLFVPAHVNIHLQDQWPRIMGNDWRLKQLFQNLIQNAIKYNDKAMGEITVGTTEMEGGPEFFIRDNGMGIHPDHFERIFQVFTKLNNSNASSGIGLSIVKKIVHHYKGHIRLQSEEGRGTTFYFTLPAALG
jgi:signal transduction histidine kinase